jgi:hypothetical protein
VIQRKLAGGEEVSVNPVRNSSGALNPVRDLSLNGINPALRGGTPYGAEPGIILKSNPAAKQRGIISNGVKVQMSKSLPAPGLRQAGKCQMKFKAQNQWFDKLTMILIFSMSKPSS